MVSLGKKLKNLSSRWRKKIVKFVIQSRRKYWEIRQSVVGKIMQNSSIICMRKTQNPSVCLGLKSQNSSVRYGKNHESGQYVIRWKMRNSISKKISQLVTRKISRNCTSDEEKTQKFRNLVVVNSSIKHKKKKFAKTIN